MEALSTQGPTWRKQEAMSRTLSGEALCWCTRLDRLSRGQQAHLVSLFSQKSMDFMIFQWPFQPGFFYDSRFHDSRFCDSILLWFYLKNWIHPCLTPSIRCFTVPFHISSFWDDSEAQNPLHPLTLSVLSPLQVLLSGHSTPLESESHYRHLLQDLFSHHTLYLVTVSEK